MRIILSLTALLLFSQCYYFEQGTQLISLYSKAESIKNVLSKTNISSSERAFLEESLAVRAFGIKELGLKDTKNYTSYIRTTNRFLTVAVMACRDDRFEAYLWNYPFLGKLPYKGYFKLSDAQAEAKRIKSEGYDVVIHYIPAFSTLGVMQDPLFSYMSDYSSRELADLILHEMTHATVYISSEAEFNENMASFIGREGAKEYVKAKNPSNLTTVDESAVFADAETYRKLMNSLYQELQAVYEQTNLSRPVILEMKSNVFSAFREKCKSSYGTLFKTENYRFLGNYPMNNANLISYASYNARRDDFGEFFQACGGDIHTMIREFKSIPPGKKPLLWMRERTKELSTSK